MKSVVATKVVALALGLALMALGGSLPVSAQELPPPAAAPQASKQSQPTLLTVHGKGLAARVSDAGFLTVRVKARGRSAQAAHRELGQSLHRITRTVHKLGFERSSNLGSLSTIPPRAQQGGLRPRPDRDQRHASALYTATATFFLGLMTLSDKGEVKSRVREIDSVIEALIKAGAEPIFEASFGVDNQEALRDEAMKNALANAMGKARVLAGAAGIGALRLVSITEGVTSLPQPLTQTIRRDPAMAPAKDYSQRTRQASATVTLRFEVVAPPAVVVVGPQATAAR